MRPEERRRSTPVLRSLPKCKALLLCDQAIVDSATGTVSLIGVFNVCPVACFPGPTQPFTIFPQRT
jgi:hypothetical protein